MINLKSSNDRWLTIQKSFEGTGISLTRIDPIEVEGDYTKQRRAMQSLSMTFVSLIKMAKEKNLPDILIFEDDCKPAPNFSKNWTTTKSWLQSNHDKWEIFSGGSLGILEPRIVGNQDNSTFFRPKETWCSHFIYVHKDAYDTIIETYTRELETNDVTSTDTTNNKLKLIISYPFLAYQDTMKSTITGKNIENLIHMFQEEETKLGNTWYWQFGGLFFLLAICIFILWMIRYKYLKWLYRSFFRNRY